MCIRDRRCTALMYRLCRGVRGPKGEAKCWYECTVQGGRKGSDLDVVQLAQAVEALGAGELLVNCIDCDGQVSRHSSCVSVLMTLFLHIPVIKIRIDVRSGRTRGSSCRSSR